MLLPKWSKEDRKNTIRVIDIFNKKLYKEAITSVLGIMIILN